MRCAEVSADEWSDEDGEEVVPAKKKRPPPAAANGASNPPLIPKRQPLQPAKRDVAFADGGMGDSSDDDDVPLAQRKVAAK